VLPHVDVFLPNREEALAIAGALTGERFDDVVAAATAIAAHGPRVVVKAGADGGISVDGDSTVVRAPGLVLDVLDTTGAGDSFDAGYLAAMIAGASEPERVRWAAVAGSLSTRGAGGTARQADRAELLAALPTDAARRSTPSASARRSTSSTRSIRSRSARSTGRPASSAPPAASRSTSRARSPRSAGRCAQSSRSADASASSWPTCSTGVVCSSIASRPLPRRACA
jgi:hypothetical protein